MVVLEGVVGGVASGFNGPAGVAVDSTGNVYVADFWNSTIRKVTPPGVVTTLAGLAGKHGSAHRARGAARFALPARVAVDTRGNGYDADEGNCAIGKVERAGAGAN